MPKPLQCQAICNVDHSLILDVKKTRFMKIESDAYDQLMITHMLVISNIIPSIVLISSISGKGGWIVVSITHLNRAPLDLLHRAWTVKSKPQKNLPCRQTPLGVAMWGLQGILHNQSDCAKEPRMNLDGKNCDH